MSAPRPRPAVWRPWLSEILALVFFVIAFGGIFVIAGVLS